MKLTDYMREVRGEMKHVNFPTRRHTTVFTIIVIIISIATAYFLGAFDFLFTKVLDLFVL